MDGLLSPCAHVEGFTPTHLPSAAFLSGGCQTQAGGSTPCQLYRWAWELVHPLF
jgi:hypothetical protein